MGSRFAGHYNWGANQNAWNWHGMPEFTQMFGTFLVFFFLSSPYAKHPPELKLKWFLRYFHFFQFFICSCSDFLYSFLFIISFHLTMCSRYKIIYELNRMHLCILLRRFIFFVWDVAIGFSFFVPDNNVWWLRDFWPSKSSWCPPWFAVSKLFPLFRPDDQWTRNSLEPTSEQWTNKPDDSSYYCLEFIIFSRHIIDQSMMNTSREHFHAISTSSPSWSRSHCSLLYGTGSFLSTASICARARTEMRHGSSYVSAPQLYLLFIDNRLSRSFLVQFMNLQLLQLVLVPLAFPEFLPWWVFVGSDCPDQQRHSSQVHRPCWCLAVDLPLPSSSSGPDLLLSECVSSHELPCHGWAQEPVAMVCLCMDIYN